MPFLGELYTKEAGRKTVELTRTLIYITKSDRVVKVPIGFVSDYASIPRILTPIIPVLGKHRKAAVVHDFLYVKKGQIPSRKYSRSECDKIFLEAMQESGVSWWKRNAMYYAVRAYWGVRTFGRYSWSG